MEKKIKIIDNNVFYRQVYGNEEQVLDCRYNCTEKQIKNFKNKYGF